MTVFLYHYLYPYLSFYLILYTPIPLSVFLSHTHTHTHTHNTHTQVMKGEMELVQQMENADDRNSERYIERLHDILAAKSTAIGQLRGELGSFQDYRASML
jgi:hypothetical protein